MRLSDDKKRIVEILSEHPYIYYACGKVGISRATFYRWKHEDKDFSSEVNKSLEYGRENLKEVAESMLMRKVKEKNLEAIKFALRHNNKRYELKRAVYPIFDPEDPDDPEAIMIRRDFARAFSEVVDELRLKLDGGLYKN